MSPSAEEPIDLASARETFLRSLMGPQPQSHKETAPAWVFGTGDRSGSLTSGPGGGGKRSVGLSPGPIYLPSPRGVIGDGPKYSFGGVAEANSRRAGAPPGPGEYEAPSSVGGEHAFSTQRTAPRYGWGTGGRDKLAAGGVVGLAARPACHEFYELNNSIGPQPVSNRSSRPAYSLSRDARFDDRQRMRQRAAAPGPGSYKVTGGTGVQVDSTKASQPQYGFSRSARLRSAGSQRTDAPLAGDLRGAVGRQVISERRSKPQYGFGSARRFNWDRPKSAAPTTPGPGAYNA